VENWDALRTARWLAKLGTISATAAHLGVHRATVVRHVDGLEEALGGKLFQRHAKGYRPTEAGQDMLAVASAAAEQFQALAGRTRGRSAGVRGELVLTSIALLAPILAPALAQFHTLHPDCIVHYEASERDYKLAYGEAHVAVRAGAKPKHPDNVVQPYLTLRSALYAHRSYIEQHGLPSLDQDCRGHVFVGDANPTSRASFAKWMRARFPQAPVVFSSANGAVNDAAVRAGLGIGFLPTRLAQSPDLVQVHPPEPEWDVPFWLLTHVDLHRTPKVQSICRLLKECI
jgi:DNA-binding transcriptional LysR family regulator